MLSCQANRGVGRKTVVEDDAKWQCQKGKRATIRVRIRVIARAGEMFKVKVIARVKKIVRVRVRVKTQKKKLGLISNDEIHVYLGIRFFPCSILTLLDNRLIL